MNTIITAPQITLIQTTPFFFFFNIQTMCDLALVRKAKDGINPWNRACNSRLGESQGGPELNHSPLPPSSNNPGKFYDIQSLPQRSHKWHILPFKFTTVIPLKTRHMIHVTNAHVYKHALEFLGQTSKWTDGGKMVGGEVFTGNHGSPWLQRNFVHLPV